MQETYHQISPIIVVIYTLLITGILSGALYFGGKPRKVNKRYRAKSERKYRQRKAMK